ncbi:NAD(P)-dependent oxidoreductase [Verrucomicrobia bacterium LW23]|nr:NAD(P)-dependent oxidoreductase [Verrucomicrobia bacterium LW23]PTY04362.1 NAD(P)-dependent oxidoreductase [Verrucomicrobia bacterium LW23]
MSSQVIDRNPLTKYPQPPFQEKFQQPPGTEGQLRQKADHGEQSYKGNNRLAGKVALITGADSGIGKAVAIAYAREGADVLISYFNEAEEADAKDTAAWVQKAGRKAVLAPGDIADEAHCKALVDKAVSAFGKIDILVNNAAYQRTYKEIADIPSDEWDRAFKVNIYAMFYLVKAALPHMSPGASIINTASVQSDSPSPGLLPYATTKGAIINFTAGLSQGLAEKGIRVNSVAPGPIWTPLIPSTMPLEKVNSFGKQTPFQRPGQPVELAPVFVMLASDEASYISGAMVPVTGGKPIL